LTLKHSTTCTAVVANSGNANACTGERGFNDALAMVDATAQALGIDKSNVLVASTGVIGQYLPIENITEGIKTLASQLTATGSADAADAIMTTDTFAKEFAVTVTLSDATVTIG